MVSVACISPLSSSIGCRCWFLINIIKPYLWLLVSLLQEGLANVCLVGASTTLVRAKIEANLPRKRGPAIAGYDKAWEKFLENVFQVRVSW